MRPLSYALDLMRSRHRPASPPRIAAWRSRRRLCEQGHPKNLRAMAPLRARVSGWRKKTVDSQRSLSLGISENLTRDAARAVLSRHQARHMRCYRQVMLRFVRVVNRHGWEVEVVGSAGVVEVKTLASRGEALEYAESLEPEWIEIGDIVGLDAPAQQHSWTTLRRGDNGSYAPSLLRWYGGDPRPL